MTQKVILLLSGVNEKKASRLVQTNGWKFAYTHNRWKYQIRNRCNCQYILKFY